MLNKLSAAVFAVALPVLMTGCASLEEEFELQRHGGFRLDECRDLLNDSDYQLVVQKRIRIGMTETGLLCSWGTPVEINRDVSAYGVSKQFVYSAGEYDEIYVYVENGIIDGWQD